MSPEKKQSSVELQITASERKDLISKISMSLLTDRLAVSTRPGLRQLSPYILLNRLMKLRQDEEISGGQKQQLGKMVALGVKQIPSNPSLGAKNLDEFMDFLAEEIPEELETAAELPDDLKALPPPWKNALADWRRAHNILRGIK